MTGDAFVARLRLVEADSGRTVVDHLELATTFWQRFRGWQLRSVPQPGTGLLISPCHSIHTFWMCFAIDVAFLTENGQVIRIVSDAVPWRIVTPVPAARAVLETPSGSCMFAIGQRLKLVYPAELQLPRSLQFLR